MESRGIVCSMKHFVANYGDGGRDSEAMFVHEYLLRNYWLRPFEAAVKRGGARSVMAAYNSLNGLPAHQNQWLLTDVLRGEWGFDGFTVADYNGWLVGRWHDTVPDFDSSFQAVFEAGLNVPLHKSIQHLDRVVKLVKSGELSEEIIDRRVLEVLATKYAVGLFEDPFIDEEHLVAVTRAPEHLAIADRAYEQSQVLLKNDGVLPIDANAVERIGFSGPVSEKVKFGDYSRWPISTDLSPMDGLRAIAPGVDFVDLEKASDPMAAARTCGVILYFASVEEGEAKDRAYFGLQPVEGLASAVQEYDDEGSFIYDEGQAAGVKVDQNAQIRGLAAAGPPVVVVLVTSSPVDVGPFVDQVAAIHQAWETNSRGALALGKILFGEVNPSGRLPMTWAAHPGQLPIYHDFYPYGRGAVKYVDDTGKPRYPFGYGLSYTRFDYQDLQIDRDSSGFEVRFRVSNTGGRPGRVVPQLYLRDVIASAVRPLRELKGFASVELAAGDTREVVLRLGAEELGFYNLDHRFVVEPGEFTIMVGDHAEDIRLEETVELPAEALPLEG